jgi:hypothetical protein
VSKHKTLRLDDGSARARSRARIATISKGVRHERQARRLLIAGDALARWRREARRDSDIDEATTAPVSTAYIGGCQLVISANGRASFNGSGGQASSPSGLWPTGAYILALQAARANGDKIYIFHQPNYSAYTGAASFTATIQVIEWSMCPHGTLANTDFFVGILPYAFSAPWAAGQLKAGLRFHQSAGDTHYMLASSDGTTESAVDTGVTPVVGTTIRCRLEFHKAGRRRARDSRVVPRDL